MTNCVHIKGSLEQVGVPIAFEACIQLAAGDNPGEELVRGVTLTFDRCCAPAQYAQWLKEEGAEAWCSATATRLALDSYTSRVLATTTGVFTRPPRN